ncbi:MAG: tetratricopeptide repeat protein [bacterium]|jgi:tetratricopeptide (TPR) repeat protein
MDLLEKGKQLTQQGKYDDALDALYLALENDKENADIHFYIGLCYSSLEEFEYAKYHYQTALSINPSHPKTKLVWDGIKHHDSAKPPERSKTRSAAAKARREQPQEEQSQTVVPEAPDYSAESMGIPTVDVDPSSRYKLTDDKWEQAFPTKDLAAEPSKMGIGTTIMLIVLALIILGLVAYFVFDTFALID